MTFDVIIIGSGTAGQSAAMPLVEAGLSVAMVDERDFGGTCAMRGCQPKKFLVEQRDVLAASRDLVSLGISTPPASDWDALMTAKQAFTGNVPGKTRHIMEKAGITCFQAAARFTGPSTLELGPSEHPRANQESRTAKKQSLNAKYIIAATGADPRILPIPGIEHTIDSEDFLNLATPPESMLTIGAGYIALEFAQIMAAQGCRVTMLDPLDTPLPQFDTDLAQALMAATRDQGIRILLGRAVTAVKKTARGLEITDSQNQTHTAQTVLNAPGRIPRVQNLGLEAAGITPENQGIPVNGFCQSPSNPDVYALGDCAAPAPMLAPLADLQARTAAAHIIYRETGASAPEALDYQIIPTTVFTHPPLSSVGLTQHQAEQRFGSPASGHAPRPGAAQSPDGSGKPDPQEKDAITVRQGSMARWVSNKRIGQTHGYYKTIVHTATGRILGAHILGHASPDSINLIALAMTADMPAQTLKNLPRAYPTFSDEIKYMF
ncbi:dihydrolipoyl dehydrogenase family protein [Spirochaeta lutea]|uniref:Pyridine nucleotide-disulfide oxidoreductase n=1 Tax=Spirochaeta lutea TaxID=1480694 RepID=A0A098QXN2_9SPIO|nr:NAD(P)/FAD-dependent oxidoreductase [Spirochaeta lutea]KGE72645.1 hypothetical protein DC28_06210 [Spirochaeta lutea]